MQRSSAPILGGMVIPRLTQSSWIVRPTACFRSRGRFDFRPTWRSEPHGSHHGQAKHRVTAGKDPGWEIPEDQIVQPDRDKVAVINALTCLLAKPVFPSREGTRHPNPCFQDYDHDHRQMDSSKPGIAHPIPAARDPDPNQGQSKNHERDVRHMQDKNYVRSKAVELHAFDSSVKNFFPPTLWIHNAAPLFPLSFKRLAWTFQQGPLQ